MLQLFRCGRLHVLGAWWVRELHVLCESVCCSIGRPSTAQLQPHPNVWGTCFDGG